jgi:hypothetical protein
MTQEDLETTEIGTIGMRNEAAKVTFMTGVAAYGTDRQYQVLCHAGSTLRGVEFISSESTGLETVAIHKSTEEIREVCAQQNEAWKRKIHLQPLGKMVCKKWQIEDFKEYDLPPCKTTSRVDSQDPSGYYDLDLEVEKKTYTGKLQEPKLEFWIEDDVLSECFVGMKLEATVKTLYGGITVLDEVKEVMCSFYKWLPNELWAERKPPRFRLMKRWLEGTGEEAEAAGKGAGKKGAGEMDDGEMSDDFEE